MELSHRGPAWNSYEHVQYRYFFPSNNFDLQLFEHRDSEPIPRKADYISKSKFTNKFREAFLASKLV